MTTDCLNVRDLLLLFYTFRRRRRVQRICVDLQAHPANNICIRDRRKNFKSRECIHPTPYLPSARAYMRYKYYTMILYSANT